MTRFSVATGGSWLALLSALGCGSSPTTPPAQAAAPTAATAERSDPAAIVSGAGSVHDSAPTAEPVAAPGQLVLARLTLSNARGESLELAENGKLSVPGQGREVGTLTSDGRFSSPSGQPIATLTPKGDILLTAERRLPLTIDERGVIHSPSGATLEFDSEGLLHGGSPSAPETRVSGIGPRTKRTAAFLLILAGFPARP